MTVREFNQCVDTLEYIINEKIIPLMANVLKAIVTLICLSIKGIALTLNYIYKITGGDKVDAAREFAKNVKKNTESRSPDDVRSVRAIGISPLLIPTTIKEAMGDKRSSYNSLERYIQAKLKPELATNLIDLSSYPTPKNRRCKKHYICLGDRCVPREIATLTTASI